MDENRSNTQQKTTLSKPGVSNSQPAGREIRLATPPPHRTTKNSASTPPPAAQDYPDWTSTGPCLIWGWDPCFKLSVKASRHSHFLISSVTTLVKVFSHPHGSHIQPRSCSQQKKHRTSAHTQHPEECWRPNSVPCPGPDEASQGHSGSLRQRPTFPRLTYGGRNESKYNVAVLPGVCVCV